LDAANLREVFDRLDRALKHPVELWIRGGAAVLALGSEGRVTIDLDVLPGSRFIEGDLRCACEAAGLGFNPPNKDLAERDYLETVPEESLILPVPSLERPYNTVFRGARLTVKTPPGADLVIGKLKRLDPEDESDIAFLIRRFGLQRADLEEAFGRLPVRFRNDPVVADNFRYVVEDYW
jgi:hypothetical protein